MRTVPIQNGNDIEAGLQPDTINLVQPLIDFRLYRGKIGGAQGAVAGLYGELTYPLQIAVDLSKRTFGGLHHRNAVIGVACGLIEPADLRRHTVGNGLTRRVVLGAVDTLPRREPLHGSLHGLLAATQIALHDHRHNVGVDYGHVNAPRRALEHRWRVYRPRGMKH